MSRLTLHEKYWLLRLAIKNYFSISTSCCSNKLFFFKTGPVILLDSRTSIRHIVHSALQTTHTSCRWTAAEDAWALEKHKGIKFHALCSKVCVPCRHLVKKEMEPVPAPSCHVPAIASLRMPVPRTRQIVSRKCLVIPFCPILPTFLMAGFFFFFRDIIEHNRRFYLCCWRMPYS